MGAKASVDRLGTFIHWKVVYFGGLLHTEPATVAVADLVLFYSLNEQRVPLCLGYFPQAPDGCDPPKEGALAPQSLAGMLLTYLRWPLCCVY